jgi:hypothetical protein
LILDDEGHSALFKKAGKHILVKNLAKASPAEVDSFLSTSFLVA